MRKITLVLMLAFFGLGIHAAQAQTNGEYKQALEEYMNNSGSLGQVHLAVNQMFMMTGGAFDDAKKEEITAQAVDSFIELITSVYEKEITLEDLKAFNDFFKTPAGKRIAASQASGELTKGAMQAGQQWGMQLQKIFQEAME